MTIRAREMAEVCTDAQMKNYQAGVDAGIEADCLWIYEDLAYTASMFFPLRLTRRFSGPRMSACAGGRTSAG